MTKSASLLLIHFPALGFSYSIFIILRRWSSNFSNLFVYSLIIVEN